MSYSLHREAQRDLQMAFLFYRSEGSERVALRFLDEFEYTVALIVQHPGLGTSTDGDRRCYPLRSFPYSLIYKPIAQGIRILVVRHQRRDPDHGSDRA